MAKVTFQTFLTPKGARERILAHLIEKYDLDADEYARRDAAEIVLWDERTARERGWYADGDHRGQVCWEGGPFEWAYDLTEDFASGKLDLPGYWLECATSFIVTLYPKESA